MRVVVTGSRRWTDVDTIRAWLEALPRVDALGDRLDVAHGACSGADSIARDICHDLGVRVWPFAADWSRGRGAGPARNQRMLDVFCPHRVLALTGIAGELSRGTMDCVQRAIRKGVVTTICPPGSRPRLTPYREG